MYCVKIVAGFGFDVVVVDKKWYVVYCKDRQTSFPKNMKYSIVLGPSVR